MTVAASGAVAIGATDEAATVVLLFLLGECLESLAAGRARAGIRRLVALVPQTALRENPNGTETVAADVLVAGDVVVVGAGERIAADGVVIAGQSAVDESPLTGDTLAAAAPLARDLGIAVRAGLRPEDKLAEVRALQAEGLRVAKVGDGINDAPALAAADVGIAFGGGTDVALETADAASLRGRVGDVAAMIVLARRTMATIRANIGIAVGLKLLFLATTLAGVTGLWPAVLADTSATVLVTANALRLLRR